MTNPFVKAEVDAAIEEIQDTIDKITPCLKTKKSRSLPLAAFLRHQKDVMRIFKDGLRYYVDITNINNDEKCYTSKHGSDERGTTQEPHPRSQQRSDSPHPITHDVPAT
jgi:hypothetical protein